MPTHVRKKPRSKTFYVEGFLNGQHAYLHRLIMQPTAGMEVSHNDGDGLNNVRANLAVVTHAENVQHATIVLGRGIGPRVALVRNTIRKKLADGRIKIYVYDRRTGEPISSHIEG